MICICVYVNQYCLISAGVTPEKAIKLTMNDVLRDIFTASNGNDIVFTQGATVGDVVEIVAYQLATVVSTAGAKGGGGIIVNKTVIDESYTFPANHSGFSIGPVTVANGVTVALPGGQRWVVI